MEGWITLLIQMVLTLEGQIKEKHTGRSKRRNAAHLKAQWAWFVWLASAYMDLYARLPGARVVPRRYFWQYIYAALSRKKMGLGP